MNVEQGTSFMKFYYLLRARHASILYTKASLSLSIKYQKLGPLTRAYTTDALKCFTNGIEKMSVTLEDEEAYLFHRIFQGGPMKE